MQFPIKSSTPQFHTAPSVQHKDYTISTPKTPQFQIKNPSVQHNPHFNTPLSSTNPSAQQQKLLSSTQKIELKGMLN